MDFIVVGEVLKPQGIRGELKIKPLTDDPERFFKLRTVYIDNVCYRVRSCRIGGSAFLRLDGVETRNDAEKLAGKYVAIDRANAVLPDDDSYFIVDLIGCELVSENGERLGVITDVDNYGSADVVTAKDGDEIIFRFPFLKRVLERVDTENKTIHVLKKQLEAVSVYED